MSLTLQQIVSDAKKLVNRLKEHDSTADALINESQTVFSELEAMRHYCDDPDDVMGPVPNLPQLPPPSQSSFLTGFPQEKRHLQELQQENRELRAALEEYQNALELIMSKYRHQVTNLLTSPKDTIPKFCNQQYIDIIDKQSQQILEMANVMNAAARIDEENYVRNEEFIERLTVENEGLRELVKIAMKNDNLPLQNDTQS